jgi:hypothetical protein
VRNVVKDRYDYEVVVEQEQRSSPERTSFLQQLPSEWSSALLSLGYATCKSCLFAN